MRRIFSALLVAFLFYASLLNLSYGGSDTTQPMHEAVKSLGAKGENNFELLYTDPILATRLLISEIHIIKRGEYRTSEEEGFGPIDYEASHVIWCFRALRSLTGLDFKASTSSKLDGAEGHFLGLDNHREVSFFGTWMSRELSFVAPEDAQKEIIAKWRSWFTEHGQTHKYVNEHNIDKWY